MPIIIVDWSDVREQLRMFTIRVSIVDAVSTSFSIRRISKAISSLRIANRYLSLLINRESLTCFIKEASHRFTEFVTSKSFLCAS